MIRQLLHQLGDQCRGDAIFLGNLIGATSMLLAMHSQVLDGNQAVVGFLRKLEHLPRDSVRSRYTTESVPVESYPLSYTKTTPNPFHLLSNLSISIDL